MTRLHLPGVIALLGLSLLAPGATPRADDTELFSNVVAPNVVFLADNSGSMEHVVWHESFDPTLVPSCTYWNDGWTYYVDPGSSGFSGPNDTLFPPMTHAIPAPVPAGCVSTAREVFHDPEIFVNGDRTRWDGRYLNWLYSPASNPVYPTIVAMNNGTFSACLGGGSYHRYRRSRASAMRHILRDVICQVNAAGDVRFGLAQFREGGDPNGGYVVVPADDYTPAQDLALNTAIQNLDPDTWTPLGETLFQIYTYFMDRDDGDRPKGKDASTRFPKYQYRTTLNGPQSNSGPPTVPDTPVLYDCQKHFVIVITDGEPTRDDFDEESPTSTAKGFKDFKNKLIGDYNLDGETEEGNPPWPSEGAGYLDDIAKFMHENDFMPNRSGFQNLDIYTVGFTTSGTANALLAKTAAVGGGLFFTSNNAEELTQAIIDSIRDIIDKVQSFTAVSVPASRTTAENNFYFTNFRPKNSSPFWEGHLVNFDIEADGEVRDKNGLCVFAGDPTPCDGGDLKPLDLLVPIWDAQDKMPSAGSRKLYVSKTGVAQGSRPPVFDRVGLDEVDLVLTAGDLPPYVPLGSTASNAGELADEVVQYGRGCEFGSDPCVDRSIRLADIFHSNPLVIGPPNAAINDSSYLSFAQTWATRTKMVYAGSNGGFLHGFVGEVWDTTLSPARYNREHAEAGKERMGFMPYPVRKRVKNLPLPATAHWYGVDGAAQAADAWLPSTSTDWDKSAGEWRTVLVGGLRQGGNAYFALDVTDPDTASTFPKYLWEFPCENPGDALCNAWRPYFGETWAEPVITRVKVRVGGSYDPSGKPFERWVAIVTGGYDPSGDPNTPSYLANATAGRAVFMIDLATGRVLAAKRFDPAAPAGDPQRDLKYAIPSSVSAFDLNSDGFVDVVYVGDLGGNLWKWVVRDVGDHSPGETHDVAQPGWPFLKVFRAPEHTTGGQTYYKSLFFPPTGALIHGTLWLALGTGERANLSFPGVTTTNQENNRFYVMKDADPLELDATPTTLVGDAATFNDLTGNTLGCAAQTSQNGFFIRLRDGEKMVQKATIFAGFVLAPTYVPDSSGDPCVTGGDAFLYGFDLFCGRGLFEPGSGPTDPEADRRVSIGVGLPSAPRVSVGQLSGAAGGGGGGGGGGCGTPPCPPCENRVIVVTSDGEMQQVCAPDLGTRLIQLESWRDR